MWKLCHNILLFHEKYIDVIKNDSDNIFEFFYKFVLHLFVIISSVFATLPIMSGKYVYNITSYLSFSYMVISLTYIIILILVKNYLFINSKK